MEQHQLVKVLYSTIRDRRSIAYIHEQVKGIVFCTVLYKTFLLNVIQSCR